MSKFITTKRGTVSHFFLFHMTLFYTFFMSYFDEIIFLPRFILRTIDYVNEATLSNGQLYEQSEKHVCQSSSFLNEIFRLSHFFFKIFSSFWKFIKTHLKKLLHSL